MTKVTEDAAYGGAAETILYDRAGWRVERSASGSAITVYVYL